MPNQPPNVPTVIKVGSRSSSLALIQTQHVITCLQSIHPGLNFEIVKIDACGDRILDVCLSKAGEKGLFTKELEQAILNHEVDFVVHSLKDMSTRLPVGLTIGCVLDRNSTADVVLMSPRNRGLKLAQLPPNSVIGTSAVRRVASLASLYPHLTFESVRGNLNTRLAKLDQTFKPKDPHRVLPVYDALVLAHAGVKRLGLSDRIDEVLDQCLYAVGQGALACECRSDDKRIVDLLASISNHHDALTCVAERSLMYHLDGGCSTPIGVSSHLVDSSEGSLTLEASVFTIDGSHCINSRLSVTLEKEMSCQYDGDNKIEQSAVGVNEPSTFIGIQITNQSPGQLRQLEQAEQLGCDLARHLVQKGAGEILERIKKGDDCPQSLLSFS